MSGIGSPLFHARQGRKSHPTLDRESALPTLLLAKRAAPDGAPKHFAAGSETEVEPRIGTLFDNRMMKVVVCIDGCADGFQARSVPDRADDTEYQKREATEDRLWRVSPVQAFRSDSADTGPKEVSALGWRD